MTAIIEAQEITREEKEQELTRVLRSGLVREKTGLFELLKYLGQKAVEEDAKPLKEYTIGVEALGKPRDYDPRLDPTVRVEIGRLRSRLIEYYQKDGAANPLRMEIPKGRYDSAFSRVSLPPISPPVVDRQIGAPVKPESRSTRFSQLLFVASMLLLLAAAAFFAASRNRSRPAEPAPLPAELRAFWNPYLDPSTPTLIVFGTPLFVKMDRFVYRDPDLNREDEIEKNREVGNVYGALQSEVKRPAFKYTGVGEAEGIFMMTRLLTSQQVTMAIKRSSSVSWEDLKGKHVILLGSPRYIRQIQGLPYTSRFDFADGNIVNLAPAPGEPAEYKTVYREKFGEASETYALISVHPGLDPKTRLMILSCPLNEGTGGAAEYVTRPDTVKELFQRMKLNAAEPLPNAFQIVVKAKLNNRVPVQVSYVTHHILSK